MSTANPFQYLDIVEPTEFVGRWPLVHEIAGHLLADRGNSQAIIAGRRCGKSSLLYALAHHLRQPAAVASGAWRPLPLFLDLKAAPFAAAEEFFAYALLELCDTLTTGRDRSADGWPPPIRLDTPPLPQLTQQPTLSLRDFTTALTNLLGQLATPTQAARFILLLDEVDETLDHPWTPDLFNQLRTLVYSGHLRRQVRLVMAGSRRFLEQVSSRGSPLNNILRRNFLTAFDQTGFHELSALAPTLLPAVVADVWQQSGGHPFLAQYIFHHLWAADQPAAPTIVDPTTVACLVTRFHAEHATDLQGWTTGVEPIGLRVYHILAQAATWLTEDQVAAHLPDPPLDIKRGLTALCYHGLARHTNWTYYHYAGDLFHTWFTRYGASLVPPPPAAPPPTTPAVQVTVVTGNANTVQQAAGNTIAQAGAVATATDASHQTIIDQRGQTITGNQINVAGDVEHKNKSNEA